MEGDDLVQSVGRLLGLAGALTRSQWRDAHRSRSKTGEEALWLAVLQTAISDTQKQQRAPQNYTHNKNAKDIKEWLQSNNLSITIVSEVISTLFGVDEEIFKKALARYLGLVEEKQSNE